VHELNETIKDGQLDSFRSEELLHGGVEEQKKKCEDELMNMRNVFDK